LFGLDRLADLLEREAASGQPAEEVLRRLVRAVLDPEHRAKNDPLGRHSSAAAASRGNDRSR
jgi:hypothetical protein